MRTLLIVVAVTTMSSFAPAEALRYEANALHGKGERKLLQKGTRDCAPARDVEVIDAAAPGRRDVAAT